jgi:hypothetical protein
LLSKERKKERGILQVQFMLFGFTVLYEHSELHDSAYGSDNNVVARPNHVTLNGQPEMLSKLFFRRDCATSATSAKYQVDILSDGNERSSQKCCLTDSREMVAFGLIPRRVGGCLAVAKALCLRL